MRYKKFCYKSTYFLCHITRSCNTSVATPHDRLPIIHINATFNNTIATVTDHKGLTKAWTSTVNEICWVYCGCGQKIQNFYGHDFNTQINVTFFVT